MVLKFDDIAGFYEICRKLECVVVGGDTVDQQNGNSAFNPRKMSWGVDGGSNFLMPIDIFGLNAQLLQRAKKGGWLVASGHIKITSRRQLRSLGRKHEKNSSLKKTLPLSS